METIENALGPPHISGAFSEILRQNRARFNAQFAAAKVTSPALDGPSFAAHLWTHVVTIVETVYATQPQRAMEVASACYEVSLELFAKNLLGRSPRSTLLPLAWTKLFPFITPLLTKRVLGATCNALALLESTPGARGEAWMEAMRTLFDLHPMQVDDCDHFLQAGQILAWRCGLAQLRSSALTTAQRLSTRSEAIARFALGAQDESTPLVETLSKFENDLWFGPSLQANHGLQIRKAVGAFRGFEKDNTPGAVFQMPPRVASHNNQFFAFDENECWLVCVDAFGASFHRVGMLDEFSSDPHTPNFSSAVEERVSLNELENPTSVARVGSTLAVTLPHSHAIYFVA